MVTSLSKRAASSGEKIVLAILLTLHHLPRQPFGGKVHLFGATVQFNRSIFLHAEGETVSFTVFQRLVRKAKPAAAYAESNFICADLDDCRRRLLSPWAAAERRSDAEGQSSVLGGVMAASDGFIAINLSETISIDPMTARHPRGSDPCTWFPAPAASRDPGLRMCTR